MADDSGLMDWTPQTPPSVFNPYQGDYMPGGWPAEPPTPLYRTTGQFDPPRRRGPLEEYVLPIAKRVCKGLFHATVTVTTAVVTVPAYAIVRRVRRQQVQRVRRPATQLARPARRVGTQTTPPKTPQQQLRQNAVAETAPLETSGQRLRQATVEDHSPLETYEERIGQATVNQHSPSQTHPLGHVTVTESSPLETPEQRGSVRVTSHTKKQEQVQPDIPFEVPDFLPEYLKRGRRPNPMQRRHLRNGFPGMIRLSPRQGVSAITRPRPALRTQQPLPPAKDVQITSPVPSLPPQPATPPSLATSIATEKTATPSTQIQDDLRAATPGTPLQDVSAESDTDGYTVVSSVTTSRKRRIDTQGSREDGETSNAKRFQILGPSLASPITPTPNPAIVVQRAAAAAGNEAPSTAVDDTLLSPSHFRNRKISPRPLRTPLRTVINSSQTPQSVLSSTCDASPGDYHIHGPAAARSPTKSELSSFFAGSPGDLPTNGPAMARSPTKRELSSFFAGSPGELPIGALDTARHTVNDELSSFFEGTPPQDLEQNAQVFKRITSGGGSPTPKSKNPTTSEQSLPQLDSNVSDADLDALEHAFTGNTSAVEETEHETSKNIVSTDTDITASTEQATSSKDAQSEIKGSSTTSTTQQNSTITSSIDLTDGNETGESSSSTSSTPSHLRTPEKQLAQLTLDEDQYRTPDQPTPKATPHSIEKTTRKTRAETRREEKEQEKFIYHIVELSGAHEATIQHALRNGHKGSKLAASDFLRVVQLHEGHRGTSNWLNDEIINAYLSIVVKHGNQDDRPTQPVPTFHAFSSYFFTTLEKSGHDGVKRWGTRAKIGGKHLLETQAVFIPINAGNHWTLAVVSGKDRTATHYNSLTGSGRRYIAALKVWLAGELGASYKEDEWTFVEVGESPQQANFDDCGVFTITSARQIMLGLTPMSYGAELIPLQRKRIVAELVAGELLKSNV